MFKFMPLTAAAIVTALFIGAADRVVSEVSAKLEQVAPPQPGHGFPLTPNPK